MKNNFKAKNDMNLNERQELFKIIFEKANKEMKGLIVLGDYRRRRLNFFQKKRCVKAINIFNEGLELFPGHWQSLFFVGKLYQAMGQNEKALNYFENTLQHERFNHVVLQEAPLAAMQEGLTEKGIKYSGESIEMQPENYSLLGNHSMNLLIGGFDEMALKTIDQALGINPNDGINKRVRDKIIGVIEGKISRPTFSELI
jgi:tetratricopeptide (TPR) repeat protein